MAEVDIGGGRGLNIGRWRPIYTSLFIFTKIVLDCLFLEHALYSDGEEEDIGL